MRIKLFWQELTGKQKLVIIGVAAIVLVAMFSGWIDSYSSMREARRYEREAIAAKRDADEALKKAAAVAEKIRRQEGELKKLEDELDEKFRKYNAARRDTGDARAEYDRIRRESRGDSPGTDGLCRELAALGYPCR